jgi:hypothetical protein
MNCWTIFVVTSAALILFAATGRAATCSSSMYADEYSKLPGEEHIELWESRKTPLTQECTCIGGEKQRSCSNCKNGANVVCKIGQRCVPGVSYGTDARYPNGTDATCSPPTVGPWGGFHEYDV